MAKKTIKVNIFDKSSVDAAVKEIKQYKQELKTKTQIFVQRLAEVGVPVIDANMSSAQGDSDSSHNTAIIVSSEGNHSLARLVVEGKDILFIEFGAGVHYNGSVGSSPNPKGAERGYTIGSYGKGQGANDWWFYYDEEGNSKFSHGTQATMPMYKASLEMKDKMIQIAKEVFGG